MKRYVLIAFALTVCSVITGVVLEHLFQPNPCGSLFARMGAAIVIIGTLISLRDFNKVPVSEYLTQDQVDQINAYQGRLEGILQSKLLLMEWAEEYKMRIWSYEVSIIVLGTSIWGFGDLMFSATSCC